MVECFTHLGKEQFWLVTQAEKGFGTAKLFSRTGDFEHLVGHHRVCAGIARIAAEGAVAAIVAAEVSQREKDFAGIGDRARLESFLRRAGKRKKFWQIVVAAA